MHLFIQRECFERIVKVFVEVWTLASPPITWDDTPLSNFNTSTKNPVMVVTEYATMTQK